MVEYDFVSDVFSDFGKLVVPKVRFTGSFRVTHPRRKTLEGTMQVRDDQRERIVGFIRTGFYCPVDLIASRQDLLTLFHTTGDEPIRTVYAFARQSQTGEKNPEGPYWGMQLDYSLHPIPISHATDPTLWNLSLNDIRIKGQYYEVEEVGLRLTKRP